MDRNYGHETFPQGIVWRLEIQNVHAMDFPGECLMVTSFGLFMRHKADPLTENKDRMSFVPWHKVIRAYQIGETDE